MKADLQQQVGMITLDAVERYRELGWSCIPIPRGTKKAEIVWAVYQQNRATESRIQSWFATSPVPNVAVIFGAVSGNLAARDFDAPEGYPRWAEQNRALAAGVPTTQTARGYQVFFQADPADVSQFRKSRRKQELTGAIGLTDGELRVGSCYSVVPPSIHPSGVYYRWLNGLPGEIKQVDLDTFIPCNPEEPDNTRHLLQCDAATEFPMNVLKRLGSTESSVLSAPSVLQEEIDLAIAAAIPTSQGQRHRMLFELARRLKAIPGLSDAPASVLKPYVQQWHRAAVSIIGTKEFELSWWDFAQAWPKVRFASGEGPIAMMLARAIENGPPEISLQYDHQQVRLLVSLCREFQRASGERPFFLSVRTAGSLLNVDPATASRWLLGLQIDGVLQLASKGSRSSKRASEYTYLGDL